MRLEGRGFRVSLETLNQQLIKVQRFDCAQCSTRPCTSYRVMFVVVKPVNYVFIPSLPCTHPVQAAAVCYAAFPQYPC